MRLNTINRPVLREPIAQMLRERIENFRHQIGGFHEPLASEFRQAATHWLEIAQKQVREAQAILSKEPSPVVFRAGDPVNREQEAFVPRYGVVGDLDKQIMLSTGCPGLVLYGRRRMGKSTVLHNLNGFLPDTVIPVVISMQDAQAFTSLADLLHLISQQLLLAVGGETGNTAANINLNLFMQWLAQSNKKLKAAGRRVLLAIDEYENIDRKLGEKIFPEDLLVTVRESIQTHRQITWIFAGSHDITELKHAEWPSYLVSARTIEVPLFTPEETRLLLTEPMKFSPLWPKDDPKRPRFAPEFWGENGIERIHREAGGWPHLVQLIAETIVDLINDETKRQVDAELFERSLNKAIVSGHNVLYQLLRGESTLPGEWEYLSAFRKREMQPPPEDEAIYTSLRRRLLVEEENGQWRLRVPLMARWLKERG
ncbi:MAG: ATP-binding protein [candidate division KSB1 bacterium]|nr:ATP-binding protein [candidate division KSB1 bacterium]MDZ7407128.1 ATP-binding protein [candidate division KSB1 bacterium]